MVAFSTIFIVVIIVYFFLYGGMIGYDLFFKKDQTDLLPKQEDEEVDISDEVGQFKPIFIDKDAKPNSKAHTPPAQKPISEETPKNKAEKTEKSENKESKTDDKTDKTKPKPNSMTTETSDDEPSNRKSLSDVGPKEPDKEERERLKKLVAEKRKELLEEQQSEGVKTSKETKKVESDDSGTSSTKDNITPITSPAEEKSFKAEKEPPKEIVKQPGQYDIPKVGKPNKPQKLKIVQPEKPRPELSEYKYLMTDVDKDGGQTRLCGGKRAENVQEEYEKKSLEEIQKLSDEFANLIRINKNVRQPDDDELEAIERSKKENRRDPVSFRGAT